MVHAASLDLASDFLSLSLVHTFALSLLNTNNAADGHSESDVLLEQPPRRGQAAAVPRLSGLGRVGRVAGRKARRERGRQRRIRSKNALSFDLFEISPR